MNTNITGKQIAKYVLLPGISPRMSALFASGFSYIAFNMALVYQSVGLLPARHVYSHPANIGRFGISHVVAESFRSLVFRWSNIDQIIIFFALLLGIVILFLQLALAGSSIFIHVAHALPPLPAGFAGFFEAVPPVNDVAFVLLDRVFGIPGLFNSCVATAVECFVGVGTGDSLTVRSVSTPFVPYPFPSPFHLALRAMMELYSIGILVVAVLIFLYFIMAVIVETAQAGTPFGKRFNHVWAPVRMVVALGLLIPIAPLGLNSAQWITLHVAKWGSGLASSGWLLYVNTAIGGGDTQLGPSIQLVAHPKAASDSNVIQFMSIVAACAIAERVIHNRTVRAYLVRDPGDTPPNFIEITGVLLPNYNAALRFYHFGDILIRFGVQTFDGGNPGPGGKPDYPDEAGYVEPACGEIVVQTTTLNVAGSPGAWDAQEEQYSFVTQMWASGAGRVMDCAIDPWGGPWPTESFCGVAFPVAWRYIPNFLTGMLPPFPVLPTANELLGEPVTPTGLIGRWELPPGWIPAYVTSQAGSAVWGENLTALGWGGAGIWYNKIAQLNGELFTSLMNTPYIKRYPMVMENVEKAHQTHDQTFDPNLRFYPHISDKIEIEWKLPGDEIIAKTLFYMHSLWAQTRPKAETNVVRDMINMIFGTSGLFNLLDDDANQVHPLAQLAGIGKSLVENSVRNIGFSFLAFTGGGAAGILGWHDVGSMSMAAGDMAISIAMMGLGLGFILYYIVPFLPFIYFFFAVGGWIKAIFEAMVGVPLWALAHIRIDGNGLSGDAAMNGYYLLLEIFIRPILIIFGLIAALMIFAAQIRVLHDIWHIVLLNVAGFDENAVNAVNIDLLEYLRSETDTFFYTVIYAIVVYMIGMASFKLIDLIPNHILRWMSSSVPTFAEQTPDPAENLARNAMMGSQMIGGALQKASKAVQRYGKMTALEAAKDRARAAAAENQPNPRPGQEGLTPRTGQQGGRSGQRRPEDE